MPTPAPKLISNIPIPQTPPPISKLVAAPVEFFPAIALPATAVPVALILLFMMPLIPLIGITEPSDIVIIGCDSDILAVPDGDVEAATAATGKLAHSIVTAGRDGVAIGTILGAEVM